jgi:hypothetical protein
VTVLAPPGQYNGGMRPLTNITLALLAAACGSSPGSPTAGQSSNNPATAAFKYASCMRNHGVSDFPDPQVTTSPGGVGVRQAVPAGAGLSPKFQTAQNTCRGILPAAEN